MKTKRENGDKMIDRLETKNLILRKAKVEDLNLIWRNIWSDKRIAENMLWEVTTSLEEAKKRMERTIKYQSEHYAYFVCLKTNDEAIGFCGVNEQEKGIYEESGICIATKYQGRGYGKEVVSALKDLVFSKLKGEKFIYGCFQSNEKSKRVCLSQEFKYLKSESHVREYDKMKYISDYYYLDKEMYDKETNQNSR